MVQNQAIFVAHFYPDWVRNGRSGGIFRCACWVDPLRNAPVAHCSDHAAQCFASPLRPASSARRRGPAAIYHGRHTLHEDRYCFTRSGGRATQARLESTLRSRSSELTTSENRACRFARSQKALAEARPRSATFSSFASIDVCAQAVVLKPFAQDARMIPGSSICFRSALRLCSRPQTCIAIVMTTQQRTVVTREICCFSIA